MLINRRAATFVAMLMLWPRCAWGSQFPQDDPQAIDLAVSKLSAGNWHERRDAVNELVRLGPQVEMRLGELLEGSLTPELRLRISDARRQIEPMRRIEPTLITLKLNEVEARTAFEEVARQEGAALLCEPGGLLGSLHASVTAEFVRQPYWSVILELCRQTGLRLRCNEGGVTLVKSSARSAPKQNFSVSGLFLVTPTWLKSIEEVGPGMRLSIYAEPRGSVLRSDSGLTVEQAVDDRGRSLLSESAMNSGGFGIKNGYSWSAGLSPLALPDSTMVRFKGTARLILAESLPTFEAPGPATSQSLAGPMPIQFSAGGVSASILRCVRTGEQYQMDMRISTDPAEVDWSVLIFSIEAGGLTAFDVDGRELQMLDARHEGAAPTDNVRVRWQVRSSASTQPSSEPYKLIWRFPAKTVRVIVPFELKDVKMR